MKWITGLALMLSLSFTSCHLYRDVQINQVTDVRMGTFQKKGMDIDVLLEIDNPNHFKIVLKQSDIDLFLEGKPIGKMTLLAPVTVPRKSVSTQTLKVHANYDHLDALLGSAWTLLFKDEFNIEAKGYATGKILFVSKKIDVTFSKKIDRSAFGL